MLSAASSSGGCFVNRCRHLRRSRVVDKRFASDPDDKEQFRIYMRVMKNFSGCRVLAYCLMYNHFHILLVVTPRPTVNLTEEELLKRLGALYSKPFVATVANELAEARKVVVEELALGRVCLKVDNRLQCSAWAWVCWGLLTGS